MGLHDMFLPKLPSGESALPDPVRRTPKILQQLAEEMGYSPQLPRTFAAFWDLKPESADAIRERIRESEKAKKVRDKYSQIEADQQSIIDNFDPYRTPIEVVILAKQTVEAAREYLAKIPKLAEIEASAERSRAEEIRKLEAWMELRAEEIRKLEAWMDRLRVELRRIHSEIAANPQKKSALEADIKAIAKAITDANENLGTVKK